MAPFPRTQLPAHLAKPEGYVFGRPTSYRPEYCELVIETAKTEGLSLTAFAGLIEVSVDTIYEWMKRHADFSDACSRAKPARVLWWERKLGRSRKGAETTASMFALKNHAPDTWRDVKHTEHSHRVQVEQLTDEQLNAIAAGQSPADAGVIEGEFTRTEG